MEWVPIVLGTFKALVFGTGMFFAIKWHHDQAKKKKQPEAANRPRPDTVQGTDPQAR